MGWKLKTAGITLAALTISFGLAAAVPAVAAKGLLSSEVAIETGKNLVLGAGHAIGYTGDVLSIVGHGLATLTT